MLTNEHITCLKQLTSKHKEEHKEINRLKNIIVKVRVENYELNKSIRENKQSKNTHHWIKKCEDLAIEKADLKHEIKGLKKENTKLTKLIDEQFHGKVVQENDKLTHYIEELKKKISKQDEEYMELQGEMEELKKQLKEEAQYNVFN